MSGYRTYQPALPPDLIHALWERKESTRTPMTRLIREAVERYLNDGDQASDSRPAPEITAPPTSKGKEQVTWQV